MPGSAHGPAQRARPACVACITIRAIMQNRADTNIMEFTMLDETYLGYLIEWATTPSQNDPAKWLGHFHAVKEGERTVRGSLVNPQRSAADAYTSVLRIAKVRIDAAVLRPAPIGPARS